MSQGAEYVTLYILIPVLVMGALIFLDMFWKQKRLHLVSGLFFGILAGLALAYALSLVVDLGIRLYPSPPVIAQPVEPKIPPTMAELPTEENKVKLTEQQTEYRDARDAYQADLKEFYRYDNYVKTIQLIKLLLGVTSVFVCVTIVMQTKDDFRFIIPYVEFARNTKGYRPILLDTSAIIDGRIAELAETPILQTPLLVPRFVLQELQTIADSADRLKRNRGRQGLEILHRLQQNTQTETKLYDSQVYNVQKAKTVDDKLVALAEHLNAQLLTTDFNLNKIAQVRGVEVLNINDLTNALKPVVLPGETLSLKIVRPGEDPNQGVGYLTDGTMVVVERGRDHIGEDVTVTITSALQTSAGKLVFAKLPQYKSSRKHHGGDNSHPDSGENSHPDSESKA
ncbi:MAG: TRAM domain-containing protein [Phycisphaerales bacterium]|nr:TRAM domain-containing protein [Phycisphaerales bacterium]MBT7171914.1 TRAM domain-containing protein [Phycisphaerales bacterium]